MYADQLIEIIESRSDDIARTWYQDVKDYQFTPGINNISEDEALDMAKNVYQRLRYWLKPSSEEDVRETYERFGSQLYHKGFRMEEVIMILTLIKRYLWLHLLEQGLMSTNLEVYGALELNNQVVLYFDKAIYFALVGFKDARQRHLDAIAAS